MLNINRFKKKYDEQKEIHTDPKKRKVSKDVIKNQKKDDDSLTIEEIDNFSIIDDD